MESRSREIFPLPVTDSTFSGTKALARHIAEKRLARESHETRLEVMSELIDAGLDPDTAYVVAELEKDVSEGAAQAEKEEK